MWNLDLYNDQRKRDWVGGLNSASPAIVPDFPIGDTIRLKIHRVTPNPAVPPLTAYIEEPWSFTSIRASVGLIDAAPERGTFKLRVDAQTTTALTWPSDLSTQTLIDAWKLSVLNAIKALSNVADGDIRADDPPNAPAHFLYFTWTGAADAREIEVIEVALTPAVQVAVEPLQGTPAYTQLIKFTQLPLSLTTAFAFPSAPAPSITTEIPGATGANEVQVLTVSADALGALALVWAGATTRPLTLAGLSAGQMQSALNEIVADGVKNPSFRVSKRSRTKYAIEFIGPLAAANQPDLALDRRLDIALAAEGILPLTAAKFDRLLNGTASVPVAFEVAIVGEGGEQKIFRRVNLLARLTNVGTEQAAEAAEAVLVRTETVYVDAGLGTPFAEVAPGATFRPSAPGNALVINHALNTWRPRCNVTLLEVNHTAYAAALAAHPTDVDAALATSGVITGSRALDDTEYGEHAGTASTLTITLPWSLVNDAASDLDYRLLKVDISSPDTTIQVFPHQHTWDTVRDTLPVGQTLRAKIAALEAAIGILSGALNIDASHITGLLKAAQIDLTNLSTALKTTSAFLDTLRELVKDSVLVDNIAEALRHSQKFLETLIAVATSADFLKTFVPALLDDPTFDAGLREKVLEALQGGAQLPAGTIPFFFDAFVLQTPSVHSLATGTRAVAGSGSTTKAVQVTEGDVITTTTSTSPNMVLANEAEPAYELLPCAIVSYTTGATIAGAAKLSDWSDGQVRTCSATVNLRTIGARRGRTFASGTILGRKNGIVFPVRLESPIAWPTEYEATIVRTPKITADLLAASSRFVMPFQVQTQMSGPANGTIRIVFDRGVPSAAATNDLYQFAWTSIAAFEIPLADALGVHSYEVSVTRAAGGDLTGEYKTYGRATAWTPPSLPFALRARVDRGDIEDLLVAKGSMLIRRPAFTASIANT